MQNTVYEITVNTITGQTETLEKFRGKVVLIVNTASQCGFTPQYQGLEKLYQTYQAQGLVVLGFPCNQFGQQEPAPDAEIAAFCQLHYAVSFPLYAKIAVNGDDTHPLYQYLKASAPGVLGTTGIKWNFTKFLLDRSGKVYRRYGSLISPARLSADIEHLLAC